MTVVPIVSLASSTHASKKARQVEVGRRERAHRRSARRVEILCFGDDIREWRRPVQGGELLRHHRRLVLGIDVGGVCRMEASKALLGHHRAL